VPRKNHGPELRKRIVSSRDYDAYMLRRILANNPGAPVKRDREVSTNG
jgi:hypothetical protein